MFQIFIPPNHKVGLVTRLPQSQFDIIHCDDKNLKIENCALMTKENRHLLQHVVYNGTTSVVVF